MKVVEVKNENVVNLMIVNNEYVTLYEGTYDDCISKVNELGEEDTAFYPPCVIHRPRRILYGFHKDDKIIAMIK